MEEELEEEEFEEEELEEEELEEEELEEEVREEEKLEEEAFEEEELCQVGMAVGDLSQGVKELGAGGTAWSGRMRILLLLLSLFLLCVY